MGSDVHAIDFHVRGEIPRLLSGSLLLACSRRNKNRSVFSRWHDSQADLVRIDLLPGRPGRVQARMLEVDPTASDVELPCGRSAVVQRRAVTMGDGSFYATQPNHAINVADGCAWATNLLFGAPLEVDVARWRPRRLLRYFEPTDGAPQVSSTSHFAWSFDRRFAYFHQSLLARESRSSAVRSKMLSLFELDTATGRERRWALSPPQEDSASETANFHSAFYFEEAGRKFVGLLRTGALIESLAPHDVPSEHRVLPMPASTIWIVEIDPSMDALQATVLPGIRELDGLALSHLDVDATSGDGFVLFANYKQADIAEETHGVNLYGEPPEAVCEHYSGMIVEALNYGMVIRYERRNRKSALRRFSRPYDPSRTSLGHTWLPINLNLDSRRERLFASFNGFRPRLLPRHIASAYPGRVVDARRIRYVPPLLMRFDAHTLEPDHDGKRRHLSYAEPVALAVVGDGNRDYVATFSPEIGLRVYSADDLSAVLCHAVSAEIHTWGDTHFRPDPAHMEFVPT